MREKRKKLGPEEKAQRDQNIYQDYLTDKLPTRELTAKYKLSHARIYQIIAEVEKLSK